MLDIPKVSKRILKMLEKEDWTVEKLAGAKAEDLAELPGVGPTTAWRLIVEARRMNKANRAEIPVAYTPPGINTAPPNKPEPRWLQDMSMEDMLARYLQMVPDAHIPEMSVRAKRIWLRKQLLELVQ